MTLWVFGYGSLLWNPGFTPVVTARARLRGFARSFCMRSIHHRGTETDPGLVLALDEQPGSVCDGLAMKMHEAELDATMAYLRERELVSAAYLEKVLPVELVDGGEVKVHMKDGQPAFEIVPTPPKKKKAAPKKAAAKKKAPPGKVAPKKPVADGADEKKAD